MWHKKANLRSFEQFSVVRHFPAPGTLVVYFSEEKRGNFFESVLGCGCQLSVALFRSNFDQANVQSAASKAQPFLIESGGKKPEISDF